MTLHVQIWSDVVCPWCYIGKRRFERALEQLGDTVEITVEYKPYQLDPRAAPGETTPVAEAYAKKFGGPERAAAIIDQVTDVAAGEGLVFNMDRALRANTRLAHRLLWWAGQRGGSVAQARLKEALLAAYFTDGRNIGDPATLVALADESGLDAGDARRFLDSDDGAEELAADLAWAFDNGITAVPTFVVNDRFTIPGAQETDVFVKALTRMSGVIATEQLAAACVPDDSGACEI